MSNIQFIQITPQELVNLFIETYSERFETLSSQVDTKTSADQKEFFTRKETATFFGVSLVTISDWTKKEIIKPYKVGNRVFYKYSELVQVLLDSNK